MQRISDSGHERKSGLANVHFLKGAIENVPLPDSSGDVISHCVINLSGGKDRVLRFHALRTPSMIGTTWRPTSQTGRAIRTRE